MKKVFDTHIHSTQKVSVEKSVEVYRKIFTWTGVEKALFLGLPQESKGHTDPSQNVKTLFYKQYFGGQAFYGVKIEEDILDKIYMQNAEQEYGAPRKIDGEYVIKTLENLEKKYHENDFISADLRFIQKIIV